MEHLPQREDHNTFISKVLSNLADRIELNKEQEIQKTMNLVREAVKGTYGLSIDNTHEILRLYSISKEVIERAIEDYRIKAKEAATSTERVPFSSPSNYGFEDEAFYIFIQREYGFYPDAHKEELNTPEFRQYLKKIQRKRYSGDEFLEKEIE